MMMLDLGDTPELIVLIDTWWNVNHYTIGHVDDSIKF